MHRLHERIGAYLRSRSISHVQERPVVVLGNQKSGTSAIAYLLAEYGGLTKTIDVAVFWGYRGARLMNGTLDFARQVRRYKTYFTAELVKEPHMTFFADQVVQRFPEARYIFVVRDPRSNIRSWLDRHGLPGNCAALSAATRAAIRPRTHLAALDGKVWDAPGENYVGVLAKRWNRAGGAYFRHCRRMHLVRFEHFLQDKAGCIEEIAAKVHVPARHDISHRVDVQFQPRGDNRALPWKTFFGPRNLACIERICYEPMRRLGYEPSSNAPPRPC